MSKTAEQYEAEYQATTEKVKRCRNPKCGSMDTLPANMYKTQGGQRIEIPGARRCGMCGTWYNLYQESYITAKKELDALIKQNKEKRIFDSRGIIGMARQCGKTQEFMRAFDGIMQHILDESYDRKCQSRHWLSHIGKQVKKVTDALSALIGKENEDAPNA